jgi:hypothetical protein
VAGSIPEQRLDLEFWPAFSSDHHVDEVAHFVWWKKQSGEMGLASG